MAKSPILECLMVPIPLPTIELDVHFKSISEAAPLKNTKEEKRAERLWRPPFLEMFPYFVGLREVWAPGAGPQNVQTKEETMLIPQVQRLGKGAGSWT